MKEKTKEELLLEIKELKKEITSLKRFNEILQRRIGDYEEGLRTFKKLLKV